MKKQSSNEKLNSEYSALISNLIESKKTKEGNLISFDFYCPADSKDNKIPDYSIRMEHIKGQFEFCALTEQKTFISLNEFYNKEYFGKNLFYCFCRNRRDHRYYLSELLNDLVKINNCTKLVYIILFSPKYPSAIVFTLDQLQSVEIMGSSSICFTEDRKDSLDAYYEYMSKVKNPCPACGQEWNGSYCYCCGHPH